MGSACAVPVPSAVTRLQINLRMLRSVVEAVEATGSGGSLKHVYCMEGVLAARRAARRCRPGGWSRVCPEPCPLGCLLLCARSHAHTHINLPIPCPRRPSPPPCALPQAPSGTASSCTHRSRPPTARTTPPSPHPCSTSPCRSAQPGRDGTAHLDAHMQMLHPATQPAIDGCIPSASLRRLRDRPLFPSSNRTAPLCHCLLCLPTLAPIPQLPQLPSHWQGYLEGRVAGGAGWTWSALRPNPVCGFRWRQGRAVGAPTLACTCHAGGQPVPPAACLRAVFNDTQCLPPCARAPPSADVPPLSPCSVLPARLPALARS